MTGASAAEGRGTRRGSLAEGACPRQTCCGDPSRASASAIQGEFSGNIRRAKSPVELHGPRTQEKTVIRTPKHAAAPHPQMANIRTKDTGNRPAAALIVGGPRAVHRGIPRGSRWIASLLRRLRRAPIGGGTHGARPTAPGRRSRHTARRGPVLRRLPTAAGTRPGRHGAVYLARQSSLCRLVAVKMILEKYLDSLDSVERFRREAEAAANLQNAFGCRGSGQRRVTATLAPLAIRAS